jgi:hypothetical protein
MLSPLNPAPGPTAAEPPAPPLSGDVGTLESLPKWLNLVPMIAQWLWLALRYRSITLPSSADPAITAGGMVGEGKMEYFAIMGAQALRYTVATTALRVGHDPMAAAAAAMQQAGLDYPIVAKPDLGWCGYGVRRIDDAEALAGYLQAFPVGEQVVLQPLLDDPGEAGIFYIRVPGACHGEVIGMLLRDYPRVVGDGIRTVAELIASDPRARRIGRDGASEAGCDTSRVAAAGETVRIATVASTRVGGSYRNGSASVTPALAAVVETVAADMTDFHVGRFDVKYTTLEALRAGEFKIIEVNGAGSEAVHAWDPRLTLREAYAIVFDKQRRLFAVGAAMRQRGHRPVGWLPLLRHHLRQQALIKAYPRSN